MNEKLSRRRILTQAGACLGAGVVTAMTAPAQTSEVKPENKAEPFRYCLNMSTISGQKLPMVEDVEVAAKAGYTGIEPWIGKLSRYVEQGGSLKDLKKRIADLGLTVESAIGFATWGVDDDAQRTAGIEQMKRDMELIAQIGGIRIAAAPSGLHKNPAGDLRQVAERYRTVLELGVESGVVPQLEIWGGARKLSAG
jgi:sugar phosphate isomerase/epimerase